MLLLYIRLIPSCFSKYPNLFSCLVNKSIWASENLVLICFYYSGNEVFIMEIRARPQEVFLFYTKLRRRKKEGDYMACKGKGSKKGKGGKKGKGR